MRTLVKLDLARLIWVAAFIGVIIFQGLPGPQPLDDSFITFRYARNIQSGEGFVYNPGEFVQGTTTPLYTILLALLSVPFGVNNLPVISFGIALFADVINTVLMFRIARHLLQEERLAFTLALVFLLQPLRINVAVGGMETSLFITVLLAAYDRYLVANKVIAAAVFCALAILIRVDAVLAIAPVVLHAFWNYRREAVKSALIGAAILLPWFLWATMYFGNPLPFSIYAKMVAYQGYSASETLLMILTFLGTGTIGPYRNLFLIFPGLVVALFLIIFGIRWMMTKNRVSSLMIGYPFLYFVVMVIFQAPLFFSWYYLPLMPGLLLLFFGAFQRITSVRQITHIPYQKGIALGVFGLSLLLIPTVLMRLFPGWSDSREIEKLYQQASISIQDQAEKQLVFTPDIGVVGWNLEKSIILDPIGLVSPICLKYIEENYETMSINREIVHDLEPDYIIARKEFISDLTSDRGFLTHYQLISNDPSSTQGEQRVLVYKRR